jgi:hypothetical protein
MAVNSLSPMFAILTYSGNSGIHKQTIPLIPSTTPVPGTEPELDQKSGSLYPAGDFVTDYMAVMRPFFHTGVEFQTVDFWSKPTPTSDPIWIYTVPIGLAGTSGTNQITASQTTITFRSNAGGIYRWVGLDTNIALNTLNPYPFGSPTQSALAAYIVSNGSCIHARDNAPLVVPIRLLTKTNDALRKRFYNL